MKYKTFKDLKFIEKEGESVFSRLGGLFNSGTGPGIPRIAQLPFDNGYGVSVIDGQGSYTNAGEFEVAVLKKDGKYWGLCYDTPITDDVIGHLSPKKVTEIMKEIQDLKKPVKKKVVKKKVAKKKPTKRKVAKK